MSKRQRRARTHFAKPLRTDVIRESAKAKDRDVNRPSFAGQRLDKITTAAGAVMLPKRFVRLYLYQAGFRTRPLMAIPSVAAHGLVTLPIEVLTT
jgi:hypothetical protein